MTVLRRVSVNGVELNVALAGKGPPSCFCTASRTPGNCGPTSWPGCPSGTK